jgi:predicted kinase
MSEAAFLFMDLEARGRPEIAWRFLDVYLQHTGDYTGLVVFRFYLVYRAMVRAKIACIRMGQGHVSAIVRENERKNVQNYIELASRYARQGGGTLLITHGLSGSGKTWLTGQLLEKLGAVRIRSDVERKRLHQLARDEEAESPVAGGIYTREKTVQTYQWLRFMAKRVLTAGHTVIVDAAFLQAGERKQMSGLARDCGVPFIILDFLADHATLRSRIEARSREGRDASEADNRVLDWQIANHEGLEDEEMHHAITLDTDAGVDIEDIVRRVQAQTHEGSRAMHGMSATLI